MKKDKRTSIEISQKLYRAALKESRKTGQSIDDICNRWAIIGLIVCLQKELSELYVMLSEYAPPVADKRAPKQRLHKKS